MTALLSFGGQFDQTVSTVGKICKIGGPGYAIAHESVNVHWPMIFLVLCTAADTGISVRGKSQIHFLQLPTQSLNARALPVSYTKTWLVRLGWHR